MTLTIADPGHPLPTVPGCVSGVVDREPGRATIQCSVCHRTATGATIFAVNWAEFVNDDNALPHIVRYRRCGDCRRPATASAAGHVR